MTLKEFRDSLIAKGNKIDDLMRHRQWKISYPKQH